MICLKMKNSLANHQLCLLLLYFGSDFQNAYTLTGVKVVFLNKPSGQAAFCGGQCKTVRTTFSQLLSR